MIPPKLLRTVAFSILTFLFAVAMGVNTSYAQDTLYVDTGGNDANNGQAPALSGGDGPVETINQALSLASDGDLISIEAGVYSENVTVDKTVMFQARQTGSQQVVTFNDLEIDGSGKTLTFEANGGNTFSIEDVFLTDGSIDVGSGLVTMTGSDIDVGDGTTAGTLTGTLTFPSNVNVAYDIAADYTSGDELPSGLGSGTLSVLTTNAGTVLDLTKDVTVDEFDLNNGTGDGVIGSSTVNINTATNVDIDDDFTGSLEIEYDGGSVPTFILNAGSAITGDVSITQSSTTAGSGVGAVDIDGDVSGGFTVSNAGPAAVGALTLDGDLTGDLSVSSTDGTTGQVTTNGDVTGNVDLSSTNDDVDLDVTGTVDGDASLDGVIDLAANAEVTGTVTTSNDVTVSGAGAEVGNLTVTGSNTVGSAGNDLTVNGDININSGTLTTGGNIATMNITINSGNELDLSAGHTLTVDDGSFINDNGTFTGTATSVIAFTGTNNDGTFTPGSNFDVGTITVNKTGQTVMLTDDANLTASGGAALTVTAGTLDLQDHTLTISADGDVVNNGTVESDSANEGGVFFTADNATIDGEGYSNIILNTTTSIALAGDVTYSGNLTFISGSIDGGAFDISPVAAGQLVTVFPENSDGVINAATFNNAGLDYNLKYDGALTGNQTIGNELTSDAQNVTVSTTTNSLVLPNDDVTIENLTVETDAILDADDNAAHTITIDGTLTIQEDGTVNGAATLGNDLTFDLATDGSTHSIAGAIDVPGNGAVLLSVTGDNVTVNGSSADDADNNYAQAAVTVSGTGASVSGLQYVGPVTLNANATATVDLITTDNQSTLNEDYGVIYNGVDIADGASLTLGSATALEDNTGGTELDIDGTGTLALVGNDFLIEDNFNADIEGAAGATVTSTGGYLDMGGTATLSADGASIPYLRFEGTIDEDVTVATNLDVTAAITNNADVTVEGDATLGADVTGTGSLTSTGGGTFTADGNRAIDDLTIQNGLTLASNNATSRTFTVNDSYTHTSGDIELNNNVLALNDINLDLTAGNYTSDSEDGGINLISTSALTIDTGDNDLSVPNLEISGASDVDLTNDDTLTILYGLEFSGAGELNAEDANDEEVVLSDDVTITRSAAGTFDEEPTFAGVINLIYDASVVTDFEAPATAQNVTVLGGNTVDLNDDLAISGTLELNGDLDDNGQDLLLTSGSTLDLDGGAITGGAVDTDSDSYTVAYRNDVNIDTSDDELAGTNYSITVDDESGGSAITGTLTSDLSVVSLETGGGDDVDLDGNDLTLTGNLTVSTDDSFTNSGGVGGTNPAALVFGGSSAQTINLPTTLTLPGGGTAISVTFNNSAGVDLASGSLVMGDEGMATFTDGVVTTGDDNYIQLDHDATADQGYSRTDGQVFGNVRKLLPSGGTASNRVEFPVGGNNLDGSTGNAEDEYSPVAVTFDDPSSLPAGIYMVVGHSESNPGGLNGFPIEDGVEEGEAIVRYPDEFSWSINTSTTLPATQVYSLEMERQGYSEYTQTGAIADVEDMRIIRRAAGNDDNDWLLQGENTDYSQNYQTGSFPSVYPTIIASTVTGGLLGGNGSIFTYGLKSNLEVNEPSAANINVGQTNDFAIVADSIITGGTGSYTYTSTYTSGSASIATVSIASDTVSVTGVAEGSVVIAVTATDELGDENTVELTVNVSADLVASTIEDKVANVGDTLTVDLSTVFSGGTSPVTYAPATTDSAVAIASVSGSTLTVTAEGAGSADITVTGTDAANDTASETFTVAVGGAFASTGTIADQALRAGDGQDQAAETFTADSLGNYFTGGSAPFTYSATSADVATAIASTSNDTLTVTAASGSTSPSAITITVTAEDATGATATQTFDVTVTPAYGDVNADGTVNALDATMTLQNNVGLLDPAFTATQESVADVNTDGNINSFDASVMLRYSVEEAGVTLPFSSSPKVVSNAELNWGEMARKEGRITVPLNVKGSGIYSVDFSGKFDATQASIKNLEFNNLPDGWIAVKEVSEDGRVNIALAGTTPINTGELVKVNFKLNGLSESVSFSGEGSVNTKAFALDEIAVEEVPNSFALNQNYPNPFNPVTNISYELPAAAEVTIDVITITGQTVRTLVSGNKDAGMHTVQLDASNLASGMYIYRIHAKSAEKTFTFTRKMTLIK